jgi:hypothetical protein
MVKHLCQIRFGGLDVLFVGPIEVLGLYFIDNHPFSRHVLWMVIDEI